MMAIAFEVGVRGQGDRLTRLVSSFADGPAVLKAGEGMGAAGSGKDSKEAAEAERRGDSRHAYPHRVVALDERSTRVLLGKDISRGGMRVDRNESLAVDDNLQIAIHVRARSEPLVVWAKVVRDDGPHGLVLRFHSLRPETESYLDKMVNLLPVLAAGDEDGGGMLVSEIIDRKTS